MSDTLLLQVQTSPIVLKIQSSVSKPVNCLFCEWKNHFLYSATEITSFPQQKHTYMSALFNLLSPVSAPRIQTKVSIFRTVSKYINCFTTLRTIHAFRNKKAGVPMRLLFLSYHLRFPTKWFSHTPVMHTQLQQCSLLLNTNDVENDIKMTVVITFCLQYAYAIVQDNECIACESNNKHEHVSRQRDKYHNKSIIFIEWFIIGMHCRRFSKIFWV